MNQLKHWSIGLVIRLLLIIYGEVQDSVSEVQFTDVDYKVFSDGAKKILEGKSVYERHTYRYSPIIALLLTPNILLHSSFGKVFFSLCDILISFLIQRILHLDGFTKAEGTFYSLFWLYNPLSIVISTRGNADSVAASLVLLTHLLFKQKNYIISGIVHGIAIHFRIYPIIFSLPMYASIKDKHKNKLKNLIYPNEDRTYFVFSCVITLLAVTYFCFLLYGYDFIFESLLYHFTRKDIRHNYSVYFYTQYLGFDSFEGYHKICIALPRLVLLLTFSFLYSSIENLSFCKFCLSFIFVTFNSVLTCQYFIWYLCILPLCIPYLHFNIIEGIFVGGVWLFTQIAWLLPAYMLEFKSANTFIWIWIQGILFFCSNIYVLVTLIKNYRVKLKTQ